MLRALAIPLAIALPTAATGADLQFSWNSSLEYDSNVDRAGGSERNGVALRFSPSAALTEDDGRLSLALRYHPTYELFLNVSAPDAFPQDVDHYLDLDAGYRVTAKARLFASNRFQVNRSSRLESVEPQPDQPPGETVTKFARDRTLNNSALAGLSYAFTGRLNGELSVGHDILEAQVDNLIDSQIFSGQASLRYGLGAADVVGLGGGVSLQQFEASQNFPGSETLIYQLFGTWLHRFGEQTTLSISAGPALITSDQPDAANSRSVANEFPRIVRIAEEPDGMGGVNQFPGSVVVPDSSRCGTRMVGVGGTSVMVFTGATCPSTRVVFNRDPLDDTEAADIIRISPQQTQTFGAFPPPQSVSDSRLTFFSRVNFSHRWSHNLYSSMFYRRSESNSSGLGASSIRDSAGFRTNWRPSSLWEVALAVDWAQRKSANDVANTFSVVEFVTVAGDPDIERDIVRFTGELVSESSRRTVDDSYWTASLRGARRLSRRTTLNMLVRYNDQTNRQSDSANTDGYSDFLAIFGFVYNFDPIRF